MERSFNHKHLAQSRQDLMIQFFQQCTVRRTLIWRDATRDEKQPPETCWRQHHNTTQLIAAANNQSRQTLISWCDVRFHGNADALIGRDPPISSRYPKGMRRSDWKSPTASSLDRLIYSIKLDASGFKRNPVCVVELTLLSEPRWWCQGLYGLYSGKPPARFTCQPHTTRSAASPPPKQPPSPLLHL